jgi:hypothetical protein
MVADPGSGERDFDFLMGSWKVRHRRLAAHHDRDCADWIEWDATADARPALGGLGNADFHSGRLPDGTAFEAMSIRMFVPESRHWRIWWASADAPGQLDPPVEGGFADGRGEFFGAATLNGAPVLVRFVWADITATTAHWEQAFSYDDGSTWDPANWQMEFERVG